MTDQQMRNELKAAYQFSKRWDIKVDKMSESQVQAVYFRLKKQGKVA